MVQWSTRLYCLLWLCGGPCTLVVFVVDCTQCCHCNPTSMGSGQEDAHWHIDSLSHNTRTVYPTNYCISNSVETLNKINDVISYWCLNGEKHCSNK